MTPRPLTTALIAALLALSCLGPAAASAPRGQGKAQTGQAPLAAAVRNFAFINGDASGWRAYSPREAPLFKAGEALQFYAEPVQLGWTPSGRGFRFEVHVDVEIRDADGRVIWGQKDFGRLSRHSPVADPQTYITGAVAVEGLPPGVYILAVRLRDPSNARAAETETAFAIMAEPVRIEA